MGWDMPPDGYDDGTPNRWPDNRGSRAPGGWGTPPQPPRDAAMLPSRPGPNHAGGPFQPPSPNGPPPGQRGPGDQGGGNGDFRPRPPRRTMAELARHAARSLSQRFSDFMAAARAPQFDARPPYPNAQPSQFDAQMPPPSGANAFGVAGIDQGSSFGPPPAFTPNYPPQAGTTKPKGPQAFRRSRTRLIAQKWRQSRMPRNPLVYAATVVFLVTLAVSMAGGGGFGAYYAVSYYQLHTPDIQALANLKNQTNSVIYDRNGTTIAVLKGNSEFNFYVPLSQISPKVQWATLDIENRSFYQDIGIDFFATLRAATVDAQKGSASQGASTITQQLVKNIVLKDSTKALTRKLNEAILAYGITQQYTKAQILEMYLNTVYYNGLYKGIEAAARYYFHLSPGVVNGQYLMANQQMDWAQAAMMAAVINNPTIYHPDQYSCSKAPCQQSQWDDPFQPGHTCDTNYYIPDFAYSWYSVHGHEWLAYCRSRAVLDDVLQYQGTGIHMTQADHDQAVRELQDMLVNQKIYTIDTYSKSTDSGSALDLAPHFVDYVVQELANEWGVSALETAGLKIYTTLDLNLNNYIQQRLKYYIRSNYQNPWYGNGACGGLDCPLSTTSNANDGAGVAIDQHNGDILAMVGSVDYSDDSAKVRGKVNVADSPRSMGSAFKPLIYSAAFQMGWTPGTMLHDVPICFPDDGGHSDQTPAKSCGPHYVPTNYDANFFNGTYPIRYMLGNSLNIAATETMAFAGYGNYGQMTYDWLQRLGVTAIKSPNDLTVTTALGTAEIPLLQLTGAYSVFADGGVRQPPRAILRVEDASGNVVYQAPQQPKGAQVMSPQAAYMMTSILTDNKARAQDFGYTQNPIHFEAARGEPAGIALAAKTGTSSGPTGPKDILTVGYSPFVTFGAWIGNANGADMASDIIGVAGAGYIYHDVMMWMYQHYHWPDVAQFPIPQDMARGYFNCDTGLAPYQGSPAGGISCTPNPPSYAIACKPWCSKILYKLDNGFPKTQPDLDWYIQGQEPQVS